MARIPKQVQKLRHEQAKLGKLGRCLGSQGKAGGLLSRDLVEALESFHEGLHYRRDNCIQFEEVSGKEIAEDTFGRIERSIEAQDAFARR